MRYILDNEGYVELCSQTYITCNNKGCTEYTGEIPDGYNSLEEWVTNANIRAYKIINNNLVYDENRDNELKALYEEEAEANCPATHEWVEKQLGKESQIVIDELSSNANGSSLLVLENSGDYEIPNINIEGEVAKVNVIASNKNLLGIGAVTTTLNGVTITINADGTIKLNGTASADIELDLKGTSNNLDMLFLIQKELNYVVSGLATGANLKLYNFNGTDRTLIGAYSNGNINLSSSIKVTHSTLSISSGTKFKNVTISPQIEISEDSTSFVKHEENKKLITLSKNKATLENEFISYRPLTIVMCDEEVNLNIDYFEYKSLEKQFAEIEASSEAVIIDVTKMQTSLDGIEQQIEEGVTKVKNTTVEITAEEGLVVGTTEGGFNAQINSTGEETGMYLRNGNEIIAEYTNEGSVVKNQSIQGQNRYSFNGSEYEFIGERFINEDDEPGYGHFWNGDE